MSSCYTNSTPFVFYCTTGSLVLFRCLLAKGIWGSGYDSNLLPVLLLPLFKGNLKCFLKKSLALNLYPQPSRMLNSLKLLCEHQVLLSNLGAETNVECLTKKEKKTKKASP